jgi:uncharacterized protein YkwD
MLKVLRKYSQSLWGLVSLICVFSFLLSGTSAFALSDEETKALITQMVERINQDRADAGLAPVELDELASQVATAHCKEMLEGGYLSHWNQEGLKPYHRYSLAGGINYDAENLYQYETTGTLDASQEGIAKVLLIGQQGFMDEGPGGAHRENILDPFHTYVGIGFAFSDKSLRMAQEFLNQYVSLEQPPDKVKLDEPVTIRGKTFTDMKLQSVAVFYEPLPEKMSVEKLGETSSYSLPDERRDLFPILPSGWYYSDGGQGDITLLEDGTFSFPVPFFSGEGVYTIVVWVQLPDGSDAPATSISIFATKE